MFMVYSKLIYNYQHACSSEKNIIIDIEKNMFKIPFEGNYKPVVSI